MPEQADDPFAARLAREREELVAFWRQVLRLRPTLTERPTKEMRKIFADDGDVSSMDFRKFHDILGWKAKNHVNCAGALYRTRAFIDLPLEQRCGTQPRGQHCPVHNAPPTVHIEHTVQASALARAWAVKHTGLLPAQAVSWILRRSVSTAMLRTESKGLPPMNDRLPMRPFERYATFRPAAVWNIVTGEAIKPADFTFEEHVATFHELLTLAAPTESFALSP